MLRLHPDKRGTAKEMVHHAWLEGIVVQGELDVLKEVEEMDARKKAVHVIEESRKEAEKEGVEVAPGDRDETEEEKQLERDAMKPVDEDVSDPVMDSRPPSQSQPPDVIRVDKPIPKKR